jgi:hypothetical protein
MECVAGPGAWLNPGAKLALLLIGDLVSDEDHYWEAQQRLAERMGVSRRTAGDAARKLAKHGALRSIGWRRTPDGATVKVFAFEPEMLTDVGATCPLETEPDESQVGRNVQPGGKNTATTWEETHHEMGSTVLQTGRNRYELIVNPDKLAAPPPTPATLDDPIALENERQRQRLALREMAHANG